MHEQTRTRSQHGRVSLAALRLQVQAVAVADQLEDECHAAKVPVVSATAVVLHEVAPARKTRKKSLSRMRS